MIIQSLCRVVKMVVMPRGLLVYKTMLSLLMIAMEISPSLILEEMEDGTIMFINYCVLRTTTVISYVKYVCSYVYIALIKYNKV